MCSDPDIVSDDDLAGFMTLFDKRLVAVVPVVGRAHDHVGADQYISADRNATVVGSDPTAVAEPSASADRDLAGCRLKAAGPVDARIGASGIILQAIHKATGKNVQPHRLVSNPSRVDCGPHPAPRGAGTASQPRREP